MPESIYLKKIEALKKKIQIICSLHKVSNKQESWCCYIRLSFCLPTSLAASAPVVKHIVRRHWLIKRVLSSKVSTHRRMVQQQFCAECTLCWVSVASYWRKTGPPRCQEKLWSLVTSTQNKMQQSLEPSASRGSAERVNEWMMFRGQSFIAGPGGHLPCID